VQPGEEHGVDDADHDVVAVVRSRAEMRAEQRGYQLAQLRKNARLTQAQVATLMGVTQARVSQIEHGEITEVDAIRGPVSLLPPPGVPLAGAGSCTVPYPYERPVSWYPGTCRVV
jgi:predicted XRE-type DNA-binding protein